MNVEIFVVALGVVLLPLAIGWGALALGLSSLMPSLGMIAVATSATAYIWHKWGWGWAITAYVPIVLITLIMTVVGVFAPDIIQAMKRKLHK